MNTFAAGFVWCVVHVTLLTMITALLYLVLRRFRSGLSDGLLLSSMFLIPILTGLAFLPLMPRWEWSRAAEPSPVVHHEMTGASSGSHPPDAVSSPGAFSDQQPTWTETWATFTTALVDELSQPSAAAPRGSHWSLWAVCGLGFLSVLAVLRLAGGWWLVRRFYSAGQPVGDDRLEHVIMQKRTALGITRTIQVREARRLGAPATVGWRRPLILLPANWRRWSDEQLETVMSHELSHVARADYAAWTMAQLGLALHFYHPLVHWLVGRLRLEQEVAADAMAATLVGGERRYLGVLARTALHDSPRSVAWLARNFFPHEGTFFRRIEMLRKPRSWLSMGPARRLRTGMVVLLVIAACMITGLRWGGFPASATEGVGGAATTASAEVRDSLRLAYIPNDTIGILAIRPAQLLSNPQIAQLIPLINEINNVGTDPGFKVESLEQITVTFRIRSVDGRTMPSQTVLIESKEPIDIERFRRKLNLPDKQELLDGTVIYTRQDARGRSVPVVAVISDRTLLYSDDQLNVSAALSAGPEPRASAKWMAPWATVQDNDLGMYLDAQACAPFMDKEMSNADTALMLTVAPVWKNADHYSFGVTLADQAEAKLTAVCPDEKSAKQLGDTLQAVLTLANNQLSAVEQNFALRPLPPEEAAMMKSLLGVVKSTMESVELKAEGDVVTLGVEMPAAGTVQFISALVPAVRAARAAAFSAQATNNMKQIMLGFHNYHDVNKHLPGPINYRKPGEPGHSWRVAILPYIDQRELYEQYNFDEPWDSENNKKLIDQMPRVLCDPHSPAGTTSSNYYVFVGGGSLFEPRGETRFADIRDGTSNTIAVVEAVRDIPWTKPEDIPFDPNAPLPEIGGIRDTGVIVGYADGSARLLPKNLSKDILKHLITRAGGERIPRDW